jgi:hypothetical protein
MAPMEKGSLMLAFGEWEIIAVCIFFMLLLPLIFFIASARRRPYRSASVKEKADSRHRAGKPAAAAMPARPSAGGASEDTDQDSQE